MPRPRERTERGHFKSRVLERNRQTQLANELGVPDQLGIFIRTKEPRDPHKKARVRPLVHFPIALKLPGPITLPPIPKEGRGRPSALTEARARLILDRKSTRLNSSHLVISYAVFCLKKKKKISYEITIDK